nr:hypothetical protein [uncultured Rhodopila sp.]
MDIEQRHRIRRVGRRGAALAVALLLAGCQAARPDFTERTRQDCVQGDQEACRMLDAMLPQPVPLKPRTSAKPQPAHPSRVQTDVQAIMKGMEQARESAPPP